jgi:seryl-tRNA synthetase
MVDPKDLRENPEKYRQTLHEEAHCGRYRCAGGDGKQAPVAGHPAASSSPPRRTSIGKQIGQLAGREKKRWRRAGQTQAEMQALPAAADGTEERDEQELDEQIAQLTPKMRTSCCCGTAACGCGCAGGEGRQRERRDQEMGDGFASSSSRPKVTSSWARSSGWWTSSEAVKLAGTRSYVLTAGGITCCTWRCCAMALDLMIERGFHADDGAGAGARAGDGGDGLFSAGARSEL